MVVLLQNEEGENRMWGAISYICYRHPDFSIVNIIENYFVYQY